MDDVKHMNQMVLYSKVVTIRDQQLIESKKLDVAPIQENMVLNILFCFIPYMWLFKGNLDVVEALEKQAGK